jgi:hypothetical protein
MPTSLVPDRNITSDISSSFVSSLSFRYVTSREKGDERCTVLRRHGIRYVQVGRSQLHTTAAGDGVTVFSDTAQLHIDGDYRLSDEMLRAGILPQLGGARRCSARAKGAALDPVIAKLTGRHPYRHYIGFELNEQRRAAKDARYNPSVRTGVYPLIQWGWTRRDCADYVRAVTGRDWSKSWAVVRARADAVPWAEHLYVAAPAVVKDKARPEFEA